MSGIVMCTCYAVSSAGIGSTSLSCEAFAMRYPVLFYTSLSTVLHTPYAIAGTEIGYAATRPRYQQRES
eukprot:2090812-Rhodomonas_salina.3